jgi:hypothetical protein
VNGLPFAKTDHADTVPIGFRPPATRHSGHADGADVPKGTATIVPLPTPTPAGARGR